MVLVLFCAGLSMWSQTVTVKGTVTSSEDGQPLSGVAVILDGTTNGTLTDLDGNWSLDVSGGVRSYSHAWDLKTARNKSVTGPSSMLLSAQM